MEYDDRFAGKQDKLGKCTAAEHTIETEDAKPIREALHARAWREPGLVEDQCKEMKEAGVIEPSNIPW